METSWSGDVKYCIFDKDGPKYLGCGTKYSPKTANIWTWSSTDKEIYHFDPIKCIFLETSWSGDVKYCIFDKDGPKYLGCGTKYSPKTANIWPVLSKNVDIRQINQI